MRLGAATLASLAERGPPPPGASRRVAVAAGAAFEGLLVAEAPFAPLLPLVSEGVGVAAVFTFGSGVCGGVDGCLA